MELLNNGKINFIVNIHHRLGEVLTGGVVAMHYLAYLLAKKGHNVYILCEPEYSHENIHVIKSWGTEKIQWDRFYFQYPNTVAVYDQDTYGDWFGTHWKARWILHDTKKGIEDTWHIDESYFNYGTFKTFNNKESNQLTAMNFYFDVFKNKKQPNRKGFCHLLHKHTSPNAKTFLNEINSTNLSKWKALGCHKYLNKEFNKHEYFITYDQKSFWPSVAALCGCKVIVMNSSDNPNSYYDCNVTPEEYRESNPLNKYGVAFGFEDLQHAIDTQHLVEDHLKEMDKQNEKTVDNFIKFWENKMGK